MTFTGIQRACKQKERGRAGPDPHEALEMKVWSITHSALEMRAWSIGDESMVYHTLGFGGESGGLLEI